MSSNSVCSHTRDKQIALLLRGRPILFITHVFSRVKECTLLQCFPYRCVGMCRLSYFDSVRDYLLSGI